MENSKDFMLLFRFEPNPAYQPTDTEQIADQQRWGAWIGGIAHQAGFVGTSRLGFEGRQVFADSSVQEGAHISDNKIVGGNMIIKARSFDEAVEMAKGCPVLLMGGSVEVRNIIPMEV